MAKILVTGATGLLGCSLVPLLQSLGYETIRHGRRSPTDVNVDLASHEDVIAMLRGLRPDVIVNLAALTNVDECECDPQAAYLQNVHAVENLCAWVRQESPESHLVQISTDQLYDGTGPHPESRPLIRNYYAFSKIAAEIAAASVNSTVLRTNFFGRSRCAGRASFSDWLYGELKQNRPIKVFDDVLFSPLSINTLTSLIGQVVQVRPKGVFNLGSRDGMSKADFAFTFAGLIGLQTATMSRALSADMASLKAYRPKDMRMDCRRFEQRMGLQLPKLVDEINLIRSDYLE